MSFMCRLLSLGSPRFFLSNSAKVEVPCAVSGLGSMALQSNRGCRTRANRLIAIPMLSHDLSTYLLDPYLLDAQTPLEAERTQQHHRECLPPSPCPLHWRRPSAAPFHHSCPTPSRSRCRHGRPTLDTKKARNGWWKRCRRVTLGSSSIAAFRK